MSAESGDLLWSPPGERARGSVIADFMRRLEEREGRPFPDHDALWQWSVETWNASGRGSGGYHWNGRTVDRRDVGVEICAALPTVRHTVYVPYGFPGEPPRAGLGETSVWADVVAGESAPTYEQVDFSHPLWVLYSSGTTGLPKGLVQGHGGILLEHYKWLGLYLDLHPGQRVFFHTSTGWVMWNALIAGLLIVDEINLAELDFWLRGDVDRALAKLRRERPVAWHEHPDCGKGFWSLTRYADIAAVSVDTATFSNRWSIRINHDPEMGLTRPGSSSIIEMDPPRHTQYRKLVNRGFTPRWMALMEDRLRARARAIVEAVAPEAAKPGDHSAHRASRKARSSVGTTLSARGCWKKNMYQLRRS